MWSLAYRGASGATVFHMFDAPVHFGPLTIIQDFEDAGVSVRWLVEIPWFPADAPEEELDDSVGEPTD